MPNNRYLLITQNVFIIIILFVSWANTVSAGQRLTVAAPLANIRSGPGTNYDIMWKVSKYCPLIIIKKAGSWYRFVDFEGDKGWIHKSLVRKILSVITNKEKCNIRSGPSTKYKIVFKAEKGVAFKVIKRKGNWINVQHADGDKGWIHKSLVW